MNILIVSQHFWPENFRINDYALALQEAGHCVDVYTGMPNYPAGKLYQGYSAFHPSHENYQGINVLRCPLIPRGKSKSIRLALNYLSFVFSAILLAPFKIKKQYDVIFVFATSPITQAIPAIFIKKLKKIPIILNVQDLWPESVSAVGAIKQPLPLAMINLMVKWIYKHCDKIMVQSKGFIEAIKSKGVPESKIFYLPNTTEAVYQPLDPKTSPEIKALLPKGFIVMFAGNIGKAQDMPTIIAAAKQLLSHKEIQIVLLGNGSEYETVKAAIHDQSLTNMHLLGAFPMEKMPLFFSHADAMLVTLKNEHIFALTIPGKIQSYLACAKPIIAAINGSGAEIIHDANVGMCANAEDPQGLEKAILAMFHLAETDRKSMGQRALHLYQNEFSREYFTQQLLAQMQALQQR